MTNLEALKANIGDAHGLQFTTNHFIKALLDEGLESDSTYYVVNAKQVDLASIRMYEQIMGAANLNEGDVGYSVTNKEYIQIVIDTLLNKWGLPLRYNKLKPKVTGSQLW